MTPAEMLKARAFQRTWSPDMEARIGAMMLADTARGERMAALRRDGGQRAMPQNKRPQSKGGKWTAAGIAAQAILAAEPNIGAAELARRSGLSPSRARDLIRDARGHSRRGPKPGEGGRERSPASIEAERLIRAGTSARAAAKATGLSKATADRIAQRIRSGVGQHGGKDAPQRRGDATYSPEEGLTGGDGPGDAEGRSTARKTEVA